MNIRTYSLGIVFILTLSIGLGAVDFPQEYQRDWKRLEQLINDGQWKDVMGVFETLFSAYPAYVYETTDSAMKILLRREKLDPFFTVWDRGASIGFFYHLHMKPALASRIKKDPRFKRLSEKNRQLRIRANLSSKPLLEVILPEGYDSSLRYPVLIVLHGYGRNNDAMKRWFRSEHLKHRFIVAYFQSSMHVGTRAFGWKIGERSRRDIKYCFDELIKLYPVKPDQIILSGMSAAGGAALDALIHDTIPAAGFILNCPAVPSNLDRGQIAKLRRRRVTGLILTGASDWNLRHQKRLVSLLKTGGVNFRFIVNPKTGHHFPPDFSDRLDEGIDLILNSVPKQNNP